MVVSPWHPATPPPLSVRRLRRTVTFLEVSADLLTAAQVRWVVRRILRQIADMAIPKRRQRSCPRALRQPVSGWPRLRKNTSKKGEIGYSVTEIHA